MPVMRLNHAVLYVRDAQRSAAFYEDVLGFVRLTELPRAIFMRAPGSTNDHDLGLFGVGDEAGPTGAGRGTVGLYHLAWEVDTLDELVRLEQGCASAARWWAPATTARPRRCTRRIPTASSSR